MFGLLAKHATSKIVKNLTGPAMAKLMWHNVKGQIVIGTGMAVGIGVLTRQSPGEIARSAAENLAISAVTLGTVSPWRQAGLAIGLTMAPNFSSMTRGLVQAYKGSLENRTSAGIPFSHSTLAMDQAFTSLQYSQQRMQSAYSSVGSEAGFFAARYMSRG